MKPERNLLDAVKPSIGIDMFLYDDHSENMRRLGRVIKKRRSGA